MGFLFSSKKEKIVAIFDIGSGSVGGSLVRIFSEDNRLPIIIKSTRTDIVSREELDFNIFLDDMVLALGFVSNALYDSKLGAPNEIICVLASPWYTSETRLIKMTKPNSFIFSKNIINDLFKKEIKSLKASYQNKYENIESKPEIIENPIIGVSLNGYRIDDPLGKKTRSLEVDMIISLSPKICLNKIKNIISKNFHHTPISFSSFMSASYFAIRDRYINNDSYLLLDIGGEVTDIAIVSNGVLKDSLSFPYGRKTLFRDIASNLKIELRDAHEIFNMYEKKTISVKQSKKLLPVLKLINKKWSNYFTDSVNSLPRTLVLPELIFMTVDNDIKDYFSSLIRTEKNIKSMSADRNFNLITLDGPEFLSMCDINDSKCDPFLMIEAISISKKIQIHE